MNIIAVFNFNIKDRFACGFKTSSRVLNFYLDIAEIHYKEGFLPAVQSRRRLCDRSFHLLMFILGTYFDKP